MNKDGKLKIIIGVLIAIIVILVVVIALSFSGIITFSNTSNNLNKGKGDTELDIKEDESYNSDEKEDEVDNNITKNENNDEEYKQTMTISNSQLMDLYKSKLSNFPDSTYAVYDINNDGILELIIKTGVSEADFKFYFYTYDEKANNSYENHIVDIGFFSGGHTTLYQMNDNTLLFLYAHMGSQEMEYYTLKNDWLSRITSKTSSKNIYGGDYDSGDKRIDLVSFSDTSQFDNHR